jgi:3-dehydroquinate synthase
MKSINVNIPGASYPVYIGSDIISQFADVFHRKTDAKQVAVISNPNVFKLYGQAIKKKLAGQAQVIDLIVPDGEKTKSAEYLQQLYTGLLENRFERKSCIIALGGGVIGDLAGYVAATYLRGINLVQMPTSLLAQVDSSIGGKVGINHPLGKNLIGAFKQPSFVFSDISFLKTLPAEEIRCGLGEIIKYGFIGDVNLFEYLEDNIDKALRADPLVMLHLVKVCSKQKAAIVEQDEKEGGLRMILNFGHTFGHALEAEFGYQKLKHGEAVILGMKCALNYAQLIKKMSIENYKRAISLLDRVPISYDKSKIKTDKLLERMYVDKKVVNENIRLILIDKIGSCKIEKGSDPALIKKAFEVLI